MMITKHFPFFLAAAEEENFQRAAVRLNIAQSALSRHISALEQYLADVRRILEHVDEATLRVQRVERGQTGHLRLAFTEAVAAQPLLADALRRFQSGFPEVQIDLIAMRSKNQREDLRKGRIDVGFFYAET